MNLRDELLRAHNRDMVSGVVHWIGKDQKRFNELFHIFLYGNKPLPQRAAWPLSYCVEKHPSLIEEHYDALLVNLEKANLHPAIKRNTLRLLQYVNIPENYAGKIMDLCFRCIESPTDAVAPKAFAITVLHNLSKEYPDIIQELKLLIDARWEHESPAFRARARKILK